MNPTPRSPDTLSTFKAALEALPSSQRLTDEDTEAIYGLAYRAVGQGHYESAFRYFSLLTLYRPTHPTYLGGLALCYRMLERHAEALSVYSFLAATDADGEPEHTLSIVECLLRLGAHDEARQSLTWVRQFCSANQGHEKATERAGALATLLQAGGGSA